MNGTAAARRRRRWRWGWRWEWNMLCGSCTFTALQMQPTYILLLLLLPPPHQVQWPSHGGVGTTVKRRFCISNEKKNKQKKIVTERRRKFELWCGCARASVEEDTSTNHPIVLHAELQICTHSSVAICRLLGQAAAAAAAASRASASGSINPCAVVRPLTCLQTHTHTHTRGCVFWTLCGLVQVYSRLNVPLCLWTRSRSSMA